MDSSGAWPVVCMTVRDAELSLRHSVGRDAPDKTNAVDSAEERFPKLLTIALVIGPACWLLPHQGAISTLLPQRLNVIAPDDKVSLLVMFSSTAMVVALFSNIILGALSDRTRSRFGKRKPWIVICSILSCLMLFMFGQARSIGMMLLWWCLYEVVVNGVASAMVAQMSDRVSPRWRGTVSSAYGMGQMGGSQLGALVAAQFLDNVTVGVNVLAAIAIAGGIVSALLAAEPGNEHEPAKPLHVRELASMFMFPTHGAREFYKVLAGRFLLVTCSSMASNYMLYIIQDYLGLDSADSSRLLSANAAIALVVGLICCVIAGPLSDRIGHVKVLTASTTMIIAVAAMLAFIISSPAGILLFAFVNGIGNGANSALIQTISLQVLPNPNAAAKDLGFLNLANTLGGVCASFVAAGVIASFGYRYIFLFEAIGVLLAAVCFLSVESVRATH